MNIFGIEIAYMYLFAGTVYFGQDNDDFLGSASENAVRLCQLRPTSFALDGGEPAPEVPAVTFVQEKPPVPPRGSALQTFLCISLGDCGSHHADPRSVLKIALGKKPPV